jgi:cytoskeletal protein CcmA (bactofilin family)
VFSRGSSSDPNLPKPPSPPSGLSANPPPVANGRTSPFGQASVMGTSVIGTDLTILGDKITIISQNKLQIDGDIRGDVTGKQVVIGEEGSVIGTVCAEQIEVRGGVRGAIKAASVTLHPTSVVDGDIFHQTLSISEGAQFDGRVRRAKDPAEIAPNLDVSSYPSPAQPTTVG